MKESDSGFFTKADFSFSDTFEIVRRVHSSSKGHAEVYEARKALKRYALKALKPELRGVPFYVAMLRKEFEIGCSLDHPGIVRTCSYENVEGLGDCIILEWIEGQTLAEAVDGKKIGGQVWVRILTELCDVLAYLEARQMVHRDLKPSNIMLTLDGLHVKLIDFGFADSPEYALLRESGGTREYASPEQLDSDAGPITHLADIYALGRLMQRLPLPESKRLSRLIGRMTADDADRRPQSVGEVREEIRRAFGRTRRRLWTGAGIMLVVLVVAVAVLVAVLPRSEVEPAHETPTVLARTEKPESPIPVGQIEPESSDPREEGVPEPERELETAQSLPASPDALSEPESNRGRMNTDVEMAGSYSGGGAIDSDDYPILMEMTVMPDGSVRARYRYRSDYIWQRMEGRVKADGLIALSAVPDPEADFEMEMMLDSEYADGRLELSGYAEGADGSRSPVYVVLGRKP